MGPFAPSLSCRRGKSPLSCLIRFLFALSVFDYGRLYGGTLFRLNIGWVEGGGSFSRCGVSGRMFDCHVVHFEWLFAVVERRRCSYCVLSVWFALFVLGEVGLSVAFFSAS